jgi:hypothetical protein
MKLYMECGPDSSGVTFPAGILPFHANRWEERAQIGRDDD